MTIVVPNRLGCGTLDDVRAALEVARTTNGMAGGR